ncbi:glutamyl-tRNA(Gln) amidotransferase subunit C, mitochondrial [Engraulis encrasicolus]|uniref:glutamyl-tRNA(Gln) amidotransferase subunit C, mitochondrial n=1 Tax=Engraulis encrasicolus TaxID=184585 RepID=UPI002FCF8A4C
MTMFSRTFNRCFSCTAFYLRDLNHQRNPWISSVASVHRSSVTDHAHNSKVPLSPTWQPVEMTQHIQVPGEIVDKLERLALVDFQNQEGVECLEKAIQFADQLHSVATAGVEPMDSVLFDRSMHLRQDSISEGECAEALLTLSKQVVDEYFVAPPGNIPLVKNEDR